MPCKDPLPKLSRPEKEGTSDSSWQEIIGFYKTYLWSKQCCQLNDEMLHHLPVSMGKTEEDLAFLHGQHLATLAETQDLFVPAQIRQT